MALALCVSAAFLFAGIAERACADHVCDGDSCPVCSLCRQTDNFLRQLKNAGAHAAFPLGIRLASAFMTKQFFCSMPTSSVKLKIRMNT